MGAQLSMQSNIGGNFSGNRGSNNTFVSRITNYYYNSTSAENFTDILQSLYSSAYEKHRRRVGEPVEGTCTWVTQHPRYRDWLEGRTSGLLWLSADPGCGKSVIASFLIDHLTKTRTDAIVCYFFFEGDSEEQGSLTFALRAILHQLFVKRTSLFRYATEAWRARGEKFVEEVDTLWDILIKAVSDEVCGDVICVVDAIDECEEVTLAPLIQYLNHLPGSQTSGTPLKFLVTSRPYHRIERDLGSQPTTTRLRGEDEVDAITADVNRVIDFGVEGLELAWKNPGGLGYLRNLLRESADRTFLWVSLVLEILKDSKGSSREEFTKIVSTTPHDLAELYTKILDKSTEPDQARRILNMVVAAARPLSLLEIYTAFKISRDRTIPDLRDYPAGFGRTVKYLCGLFVRVIDSKVHLVHQTAREFLVQSSLPGQGNWQYTLCPQDSHFILADVCISYLSLADFENAQLAISLPYRTRTEYRNRMRRHVLLDYAANHWAAHFRDAQARQMELFELTGQICERGSKRFLTWLKVYWVNNCQDGSCPSDFTHLMIASWLGQQAVVERLLDEGAYTNARSAAYGTALNVATLRKDESITRMLVERNTIAFIGGRGFKISQTKVVQSPRSYLLPNVVLLMVEELER